LHVLYVIDSLTRSGAEQSLASLAPHYRSRGVDLDVAYLHDRPGLQAELEEAGARLFCLAGPGGRVGWVRRIRNLLRERHPDLVHTTLFESNLGGRIAGRLSGIPVVSSLVNVAYGESEELADPRLRPWKVRSAQLLDAATARFVVRFHAISGHVADVMAARLRVPRDRIDVVTRGRDPAVLGRRTPERRAQAREALGVAPGTPLLLAAARQEHQKGLDILLEAMPHILERVPDAVLAVAGRDGNQTPVLRSTVERLGLGVVHFLGARSDVADLLCAADAFVLPSRWEGLGSVLLEAMALEAPIVASDLPAVREILRHEETAFLVAPRSPEALAEAVAATISDPGAAAQRAERAYTRFREHFTTDRIADGMIAFYERALASR
jgi:glycosyltransferase involved in cell wall biosynthesis